MASFFILLIKIYQKLLSPLFPGSCRFYPCCSNFSIEAIRKYGCILGIYCTGRRILKCNPFHDGGIDLVEKYERDKGFIALKRVVKHTKVFFRRWILHRV